MIDIRELRYFVQVARAGSFSRASTELNVAQPALSRQLQKLEEELGIALLVRHGRGVRPTAAGTLLLERAESILGNLRQLPDHIRDASDAVVGHVVLGLPPAAGLLIAPEIVARFRARWPHATLHLKEGISSSLEEWLLGRRLDIAVLHNPVALPGLNLFPIMHENMVVAGPGRGMPPGEEAPIRWREIAETPLILPSLPHSNRRFIEQEAARRGVRLTLAMEIDSVSMTKVLVRRGFGSTILTYAAVAAEVASGEISARRIDRPPLISTISIGTTQDAMMTPLTRDVFELLRDVMRDLVASGTWIRAQWIEASPRRS
jgi:LysR family nitrogen assimilation transcriptional regulator